MDPRSASVESGGGAHVLQLCEAEAFGVQSLQGRRAKAAEKGECNFRPAGSVKNPLTRAVVRVKPANLTGGRAVGTRKLVSRKIKASAGNPSKPLAFASIQELTPAGLVLRGLCLGEKAAGFGYVSRFRGAVGARALCLG